LTDFSSKPKPIDKSNHPDLCILKLLLLTQEQKSAMFARSAFRAAQPLRMVSSGFFPARWGI
jgi:hypothetical protein